MPPSQVSPSRPSLSQPAPERLDRARAAGRAGPNSPDL